MTIDVGNFYLATMKERLAKAEKAQAPPVSNAERLQVRKDFSNALAGRFGAPVKFSNNMDDCRWFLDGTIDVKKGMSVRIDQSEMDKSDPLLKGVKDMAERENAHREGCKKACAVRNLMETGEINRFKSFVRAAKAKPTREDCETLLRDFLTMRGHVCPV